jgi:riboflavin kinase
MLDSCLIAKIVCASNKNGGVTQETLARELSMSQQTVSRKLKELEEKGLIRRTITPVGEIISLSEKGQEVLSQCLELLKNAITSAHAIKIIGKVTSGLGEGRIFLSLPYYKESFEKFLGFTPYPGTLNLVIYDRVSLENRLILDTERHILIPEFKSENRILGAVKAFPASINGLRPAAIVFPLRSTHPKSIIEIISPYHLREKLNLKDGDDVEIEAYV